MWEHPELFAAESPRGVQAASLRRRRMNWIALLPVAVERWSAWSRPRSPTPQPADEAAAAIAAGKLPPGYRDWRLISVAREEGDLDDIRAILGNDSAIKAYREGTLPFPDGTIIARLAWGYDSSEENNKAFGRPIVRGRAPEERRPVHGQGLQEVRLDRRLGIRAVRRRQTPSRRGDAPELFRVPPGGQGSRLRLHPLRALKARARLPRRKRATREAPGCAGRPCVESRRASAWRSVASAMIRANSGSDRSESSHGSRSKNDGV